MKKRDQLNTNVFIPSKDVYYIKPDTDEIENKRVINSILNAWEKGSAVDWIGRVFVQKSYLNVILRTTKDLAKYYTSKIEESKIVEYEGKKFIRGSEILRLLDIRM